ncbi:MAG: hypothetical protein JWM57_1303 [Phycisphaerales bacterium]|nr:hypothetical protein [Phycisphaerales bacterium]
MFECWSAPGRPVNVFQLSGLTMSDPSQQSLSYLPATRCGSWAWSAVAFTIAGILISFGCLWTFAQFMMLDDAAASGATISFTRLDAFAGIIVAAFLACPLVLLGVILRPRLAR